LLHGGAGSAPQWRRGDQWVNGLRVDLPQNRWARCTQHTMLYAPEDSTMARRKAGTKQSSLAGNARRAPEERTTGDEPMTAAQHSYLQTLCDEAGEPMDETLTKAQAAQRIDALQQKTGRGVDANRVARSRQPHQGLAETGATGRTLKDPEEWTTGDEPMTAAQRSYLKTLSEEAGEAMDETLTKAQASERIEALQRQTGRGALSPKHPASSTS